jgi:hypothetical protein
MKNCKICKADKDNSSFRMSKKTGKLLNPCDDCWKQRRKEYNKKSLKQNNSTKDAWAKRNPEKVKAARAKWKKNNIGFVKADKAKRKDYVEKATPKWLTKLQLEAIDMKYEYAELKSRLTGIKQNVDHIIPLRNKDVCGLNVPWNLEVIPEKENIAKSNKLLWWRLNG